MSTSMMSIEIKDWLLLILVSVVPFGGDTVASIAIPPTEEGAVTSILMSTLESVGKLVTIRVNTLVIDKLKPLAIVAPLYYFEKWYSPA